MRFWLGNAAYHKSLGINMLFSDWSTTSMDKSLATTVSWNRSLLTASKQLRIAMLQAGKQR